MLRAAILLGVAAACVAAAPAEASTVAVNSHCGRFDCAYSLDFKAAPGEANVVTVERVTAYAYTFRDAGATLTAGRGCAAAADASVTCTAGQWPDNVYAGAHLGDGDDVATGAGMFYGEAGEDRITGNGSGGPGDDVLMAQDGWFFDDDGADPGHDVYRSWSGTGSVSYENRRDGVLADVRPGSRSEDRLEGIRKVVGGAGDDVLIGGDGPNWLIGNQGADRLVGGDGDDTLEGGDASLRPKRDVLDAGAGADRLKPGDRTSVRCGPGVDRVAAEFPHTLDSDCELIGDDLDEPVRLRAVLPSPGSAILLDLLRCEQCRNDRWRAEHRGRVVGTVTLGSRPAHLRLDATGRRLLRRHGRLTLRLKHTFAAGSRGYRGGKSFVVRVRLRAS